LSSFPLCGTTATVDAGAVTWADGDTGISGDITQFNSLVGTKSSDQVGDQGVTELENGNFVVGSTLWDNGMAVDAGAVTWANGQTGISGPISAANSLVGGTSGDQVGSAYITTLTETRWSFQWDNVGAINAGSNLRRR
jgi:hypothetical protein